MTEPVMIPLDQIEVGDRLRRVDQDVVDLIAEGFRQTGQIAPILVRRVGNGFALVAGAHRLKAAHVAGWPEIEAKVFEGSEAEARLQEIDENLLRRELSELDRAAFLAERKKVWLTLHPETGRGGDRKSRKMGTSDQMDNSVHLFPAFADEVANKLGISARTIRRAVRRFDGLDRQVREQLALTPFADRASELDALCKLDAGRQRKIVTLLLREKNPARNVAAALAQLEGKAQSQVDPAEQQLAALMRAWQRAGGRVRRRFLDAITASGDLDAARGAK